mmetsp:Transcript_12960/g.31209  ORF Transcript_12960/g.31209 Transcript_12960/m.31209 type:complete len:246 (-) Transcript_12960:52-789(-)
MEHGVRELRGDRNLHPALLVPDAHLAHTGPPHSHHAPPRPVVGLLAHDIAEPSTPRHQLSILSEAEDVDIDVGPVGVGLHDHIHLAHADSPEPPGDDHSRHHHSHHQPSQVPPGNLHGMLDGMLLWHIEHPQNRNLVRQSHGLHHISLHELSCRFARVLGQRNDVGGVVEHPNSTPPVRRLLVLPSGEMRSGRQGHVAVGVRGKLGVMAVMVVMMGGLGSHAAGHQGRQNHSGNHQVDSRKQAFD